jgi:hypothetical protein
MGSVLVEKREALIHARYVGAMSLELVQSAAQQILALLEPGKTSRVLFDTLEMKEPDWRLTRWMQQFEATLRNRVTKSAVVVPDLLVATQAKAAFVSAEQSQVFDTLEDAVRWLKD